jgi:hypothetical protein
MSLANTTREESLAVGASHIRSAQCNPPGVLKLHQDDKRCGEFVCRRNHKLTPDQVIKRYLIQVFV